MLYFAYGSNLNLRTMKRRCPQAVAVETTLLPGYRLEFRNYATIVVDASAEVAGALYRLTPSCWRALDTYEGDAYDKITVSVGAGSTLHEAIAYVMKAGTRAPPTTTYFSEIARGYTDWKLDGSILRRARLATLHQIEKKLRR
jgi:gamma-glutamylcyclotransferase (GGCT)/AIG2-like uncharacterized protein YtfP